MRRSSFIAIGLLAATVGRARAAEPITFEQHVRPILKAYCLDCHGGGEKPAGGLDLRLKRFAVAGGKNGPAVVAKEPGKSALVERMKSGEMPPGEKKVPADQLAVIEKWIAAGAPTLRDEPATLPPGLGITADERAYWFYQPLGRPAVPEVRNSKRPIRNPIDAFVLTKLREKNLDFNPEADRRTLILRASFDLTGLPPTAAEIEQFVQDDAPDAYEKLIDRLFASPRYGERWGRHWLDVAGYADSEGDGNADTVRPHAWRYRDYVIRALNADKPLNQFVTEQLAGDELVPRPWTNLKPEQVELLAATAYLRTAPDGTPTGAADAEQVVTDVVKVVSSGLLGTSVGCAQCHDHRYDPVPQRDYFQLRAVFEPALDPGKWRKPAERLVSLYTDADRARAAAVAAETGKMQAAFSAKQSSAVRAAFELELAKFPEGDRAKLKAAFDAPAETRTAEQKKLVASNPKLNITPGVLYQYNQKVADELKAEQAKIAAKRAERPAEGFVSVVTEVPGRVPETKLHYRGDARQPKGPALAPADLTIAAPDARRFEMGLKTADGTTGRRLAWAKHITDGTHPLFGRVMANRIWLNHFGRGIVDTPGEFGRLGQLPTHPELLDWLATELPNGGKEKGWSLKRFHKLIMTSTTYRQSSRRDPAKDEVDRSNTLYGRFPVRRLEAEAVRDRILLAAGRLDLTPFGPPVAVVEDGAGQVGAPDDQPRRSVYLQVRRTKPVAFLSAFDAPALEPNCDRRNTTTTAPQALMLVNSDFVRKQAAHLAARVKAEAQPGAGADALATAAWRAVYLRAPDADEAKLAAAFLDAQPAPKAGAKGADLAALTNLCQMLLTSNEFLYVD
ncbi:PSD1 and planctomycete cytochrome C domain-containing protein [Gemmata sp. JC717]|uniref:PSD1 and planctomycete cytochrome C domain-containing protein n=1 Tax=Gemmata algarum TaxID=2975278 RepID=UPI0021BB11A9|nr:PSD1 and planctomycete cytochrome C domain-containing protein [Gemmata algarum]MDY3552245.1 PSD1 and planctomycete cytochrome C domain-containing protein [Gemmata algarum]